MELIFDSENSLIFHHDGHDFYLNKNIIPLIIEADGKAIIAHYSTGNIVSPVLKKSLYGEYIIIWLSFYKMI